MTYQFQKCKNGLFLLSKIFKTTIGHDCTYRFVDSKPTLHAWTYLKCHKNLIKPLLAKKWFPIPGNCNLHTYICLNPYVGAHLGVVYDILQKSFGLRFSSLEDHSLAKYPPFGKIFKVNIQSNPPCCQFYVKFSEFLSRSCLGYPPPLWGQKNLPPPKKIKIWKISPPPSPEAGCLPTVCMHTSVLPIQFQLINYIMFVFVANVS